MKRSFDADLHIHGRYSKGTSRNMSVGLIAEQAPLKGLDIVATADALNPRWMSHLKSCLEPDGGGLYVYGDSPTKFMVQAEVEDERRIHHLIFFPDLSCAESVTESIRRKSKNIESDGRPIVSMSGAELASIVHLAGGLIGPAHAFTPWTSIYKAYDSISESYGRMENADFLELGLSADTDMADRIAELSNLTFLSNSDCHSPWPHRMGREFNRLSLRKPTFEEIRKAIKRKGGRRVSMNVGLNPLEGKYHRTACSRCYLKFSPQHIKSLGARCPECGGIIKKGVDQRIDELSDGAKTSHPKHRPPYVRILPLAQVISLATGFRTLTSKRIIQMWNGLVKEFETEISVLLDAEISKIIRFDAEVGRVIDLFRRSRMNYIAGGGGMYGRPTLKKEKDRVYSPGQKTLDQY